MSAPESPGNDRQRPNTRRSKRVPLEARIDLEFESFLGFLTEYSGNISEGGMFVKSASPPPGGSLVHFTLRLQDDFKLIQGKGEVVWVREADDGELPAGMGIRFLELVEPSPDLIRRIVERRQQEGAPPFDLEHRPRAPQAAALPQQGELFDLSSLSDLPDLPDLPGLAPVAADSQENAPAAVDDPEFSALDFRQVDSPDADLLESEAALAEPVPAEPARPREGPPEPVLKEPVAETPRPRREARQPLPLEAGARPEPEMEEADLFLDSQESLDQTVQMDRTLWPERKPPEPGPATAAPQAAEPREADLDDVPFVLREDGLPPTREPRPPEPAHAAAPARHAFTVSPALAVLLLLAAIGGAVAYRLTETAVAWVMKTESGPISARELPPPAPEGQAEAVADLAEESEPEPLADAAAEPASGQDAAAEPPAAAVPAPVPARTGPPATAAALSEIRRITAEAAAGGTRVSLWGNGALRQGDLTQLRLEGKVVVKIKHIESPLNQPVLDVGTAELLRVRTGYHLQPEGNELHVVLDLADDGVALGRIEPEGSNIHLYLTR